MKTKFTFSKTTKLLTTTMLSFAFMCFSLGLAHAQKAEIMKTDAAPAIDGNAGDPMWGNATAYSLDSVSRGEPSGTSATWKALWDAEFIYILVEVEDDIIAYPDPDTPWENDAVEVFFDIANTDTSNSEETYRYKLDPGDWQFRYNLYDESIAVGRGEDGVATDSKDGAHAETGTNWVVELKFKWSELGASLPDWTAEKGAELGIEVAVIDHDDEYKGNLSWYANANEAHKNPMYFGDATLVEPIPAQTSEIMKTDAAPAIDGNGNDPMWENATEYNIETVSNGEQSNNTATWKALWDEEFVYILVEVQDDILNYSADIKEWNRDAIEVFFDINNTDGSFGETFRYDLDPGDWQFRYNLVDKSISVGRGEEGVATDSKDGDHTETGTNYTVELKFKWSELGASVPDWATEKGAELGLDVSVMDNDGDFVGALSWNADANEGHKNSLYFGTATLEEPIDIPQKTGEIMMTSAAPAIDGNGNDPMWENATAYNIETVSNGEQSNNTATWKALWDEEFVYILVEVQDDILNYSADIKEWNRDAIEVFFDINNTDGSFGETFRYDLDPGDWQFRYNLVDKSISVGRGEEGVATDSKDGDHTETGTNYTVELKFKWSELGASVPDWTTEEGAELGLDVSVMDNDGDFVGALSWNADANEGHKNSLYFGTATLVLTTGINDIKTNTVDIYPNPVTNELNIENAAANQMVSIYSITGQAVKNVRLENSTGQIDVTSLKEGVYIIQVMDNYGHLNITKFVKK